MSTLPILKLVAKADQDLIVARFRARQIADFVSMTELEKTRLVAVISEAIRNALARAGEARVEFNVTSDGKKQFVQTVVNYRPGPKATDGQKLSAGLEASR